MRVLVGSGGREPVVGVSAVLALVHGTAPDPPDAGAVGWGRLDNAGGVL